MESYYRECIDSVKKNIDSMESSGLKEINARTCSDYDFVYYWTNEDIANSLKVAGCKVDSALTVLSSGDHPFNLATLGAKNIDTFDSNKWMISTR